MNGIGIKEIKVKLGFIEYMVTTITIVENTAFETVLTHVLKNESTTCKSIVALEIKSPTELES